MSTVSYILERLSEKSTYATITAVLGVAGVVLPPGVMQDITLVGMGASALAGIIIKEGWRHALTSGDAAQAVESAVTTISTSKTGT